MWQSGSDEKLHDLTVAYLLVKCRDRLWEFYSVLCLSSKSGSEVPIQTRAPVFGDAAASRERVLDHLSDKEKEDECRQLRVYLSS